LADITLRIELIVFTHRRGLSHFRRPLRCVFQQAHYL
jgi:hypothetical protein